MSPKVETYYRKSKYIDLKIFLKKKKKPAVMLPESLPLASYDCNVEQDDEHLLKEIQLSLLSKVLGPKNAKSTSHNSALAKHCI